MNLVQHVINYGESRRYILLLAATAGGDIADKGESR
jgi:hypothetical protein